MQDEKLLNEALDFIVKREQDNDYICEMPKTDKQQITDTHGRYKKRTYAKDQTRFSLRIDDELAEWVEQQSKKTTKNRYINGLIRQDMEQNKLHEMAVKNGKTLGEMMTVCRLSLEEFDKRVTDKVKEEVARHQRVR